jgi:Pyruvate/2-oxoacid:ferredoxin oxidoreductase gamma subunit
MLGFAFFKAGFYPQCFSVFGGERRGAPVVSFLRVDQEKILKKLASSAYLRYRHK